MNKQVPTDLKTNKTIFTRNKSMYLMDKKTKNYY